MNDTKHLYQFTGQGDCHGLIYNLVDRTLGAVFLWSLPLPDNHPDAQSVGGYSWRGPATEFAKHFKRVR